MVRYLEGRRVVPRLGIYVAHCRRRRRAATGCDGGAVAEGDIPGGDRAVATCAPRSIEADGERGVSVRTGRRAADRRDRSPRWPTVEDQRRFWRLAEVEIA